MLGPCHLVVSGLYAGTRRLSPWWWRSSIRTHTLGLPNTAHRRSHIVPVARTLEDRLPCSDSDMGCSCGPLHSSWFVWSAVANGVPRLNTVHLSLLPAVHLTHQIEHSIRWRRKRWLGRGCGEEHGEVGLRCGVRLLEFERSIADVDHQVEGTSAKFLYHCTESQRNRRHTVLDTPVHQLSHNVIPPCWSARLVLFRRQRISFRQRQRHRCLPGKHRICLPRRNKLFTLFG